MKFIENSVEAIKFQEVGEMASCDVVQVNGDKDVKKRSASCDVVQVNGDADVEKSLTPVESKISNGVHNKVNGETEGFLDGDLNCDDEEFHLELEASSEDGSPMKTEISAEALTKEITALLGESSEGIDEELKKIDVLKSDELIDEEVSILNGEGISQSSVDDQMPTDSKVDENISEAEKERSEESEDLQKENSETEIGRQHDIDVEEDIWLDGKSDDAKPGDLEDDILLEEKSDYGKPDTQTSEVSACEPEEKTLKDVKENEGVKITPEIPLSQTSDLSENDGWTVIDSVETSEDEQKPKSQEKESEAEAVNSEEMIVLSEAIENEEFETIQTEEKSRKRSASVEEQVVEQKKVKLDEDKQSEEKVPLSQKRYSSDVLENETKRTKPNGLLSEDEDSEMISSIDDAPDNLKEALEGEKSNISVQDSEILLSKEDPPDSLKEALEEDKSNISAQQSEIEEITINSDAKTPECLPQVEDNSLDVNMSDLVESSDCPVNELSSVEDGPITVEEENKVDETVKGKEELETVEEPLIASKSTDDKVEEETLKTKATSEDVIDQEIQVEENSKDQVEEKPSDVQNIKEEIEIVESEIASENEPSSQVLDTNLIDIEVLKEDEVDSQDEVQEKSDTKEAIQETPSELKETVQENAKEKECEEAIQETSMELTETVQENYKEKDCEEAIQETSMELTETVQENDKEKECEESIQETSMELTETVQENDKEKECEEAIQETSMELTETVQENDKEKECEEAIQETSMELTETVQENAKDSECVVHNETISHEAPVKPLLSFDDSKPLVDLPTTSSKTESEVKINLEHKEACAETEKNTCKEDKADKVTEKDSKINVPDVHKKIYKENKSLSVQNSLSKKIVEVGFVNNKIPYKLTPIDTEPIVKKQRVLTPKENDLSNAKLITVVKPKPESEPRTKVEDKKTYATLQPMEVIPIEEEIKQTLVTSKVDSSKRKLSIETETLDAKTETKAATNLDKAIESVVKKSRSSMFMVLKKFHKSQLRKMTRSELEETVVLKICEAVTDKSELGQMRKKYQRLEQDLESWKKKASQYDKQIRELDMVLKRYLSEAESHMNQKDTKPPLPIKVTRSVGLQVVLASSMYGQVVNKSKQYQLQQKQIQQQQQQQQLQHQQQMAAKQKIADRIVREAQARAAASYQSPNNIASRKPGRPAKTSNFPPAPSIPTPPQKLAPAPNKPTVATLKPAVVHKPAPPVKPTPPATPSKDLEVIDLTEKDERTKVTLSPSAVGGIRVKPQTQVCFVQQSVATTPTTQMAYIVQKPGQRQQYLVATSSASPPKPTQPPRPPPALAMPNVYRNTQLIPVSSSQPGVRTANTVNSPLKTVVPTLRPPQPAPVPNNTLKKHPAPLPSAPPILKKPGLKMLPSKPLLKIAKTVTGIMLSWSMSLTDSMAEMASYQLFAYQEGNQAPTTALWKKVGDVKALPLPMACTLTQFIEGHKYHFAVRAVDVHGRIGPFSHPGSILLKH